METRKGAFAHPFLRTNPPSRSASRPLQPGPTLRSLDTRHLASDGSLAYTLKEPLRCVDISTFCEGKTCEA